MATLHVKVWVWVPGWFLELAGGYGRLLALELLDHLNSLLHTPTYPSAASLSNVGCGDGERADHAVSGALSARKECAHWGSPGEAHSGALWLGCVQVAPGRCSRGIPSTPDQTT